MPVANRSWNTGDGRKHSDEVKERMKTARLNESDEIRKKRQLARMAKLVGNKFGKKHTEKTKNKMSVARTGSGNSFFGKRHTEETKAKIASAHCIRRWSKKL